MTTPTEGGEPALNSNIWGLTKEEEEKWLEEQCQPENVAKVQNYFKTLMEIFGPKKDEGGAS